MFLPVQLIFGITVESHSEEIETYNYLAHEHQIVEYSDKQENGTSSHSHTSTPWVSVS
jgi:hypothetical protein